MAAEFNIGNDNKPNSGRVQTAAVTSSPIPHSARSTTPSAAAAAHDLVTTEHPEAAAAAGASEAVAVLASTLVAGSPKEMKMYALVRAFLADKDVHLTTTTAKYVEAMKAFEGKHSDSEPHAHDEQLWQDYGAKTAVLQLHAFLSAIRGLDVTAEGSVDDCIPIHVLRRQISRQIKTLKEAFKSIQKSEKKIQKQTRALKKGKAKRDALRAEALELLDGMFGMPRSLSAIDAVAQAVEENIQVIDSEIQMWASRIAAKRRAGGE